MPARKICVATATRAEYGLLRWLMHEIREDADLALQVLVTGAHLSSAHGETWREIEEDGFRIDAKVDMRLGTDTAVAIAHSMGHSLAGTADALASLRPDILVVLGDRYEFLPIASAATVMNVPIAHVSGGDLTEGAIDNQIRHAVTKLAHLHFPGTEESAARIVQMGEDPARVFAVGEPGLDHFVRTKGIPRAELAASLDLDPKKRWVLFTHHPETAGSIEVDVTRARAALDAIAELRDVEVVMTYPNADLGGQKLVAVVEERHARDAARFKLFKSVGHDRFVSLMREGWAMVGNSSAGVVEAPTVALPVVNIGDRQRGRITAENVITVDGSADSLRAALRKIEEPAFRKALTECKNPYGDGKAAVRIKDELKSFPLEGILRKPFHAPHRR